MLTTEFLRNAFDHMKIRPTEERGQQGDKLKISRGVFAGRVVRLQERGLIINTIDFDPSREMMLEWVTAIVLSKTWTSKSR